MRAARRASELAIAVALSLAAPAHAQAPLPKTRTTSAATTATTAPKKPTPGAPVRVGDRVVFVLKAPRDGMTARERAAEASRALERAAGELTWQPVHVEPYGEVAIVYAGKLPIVQLTRADAEISRDPSLEVHAAEVAGAVSAALREERTRKSIADLVFSVSLAVFSGLIAFLGMRKLGDVAARLRASLNASADRIPDLYFGGVEMMHKTAVQGALLATITAGKVISQLAAIYLWLLITLSLFDATRTYTDALAGFVLDPLSGGVKRLAATLPLLAIAALGALGAGVLLRAVRLLFGSVARGETHLGWLPQDLAGPASVLLRAGIALTAVVLIVPLVVPGSTLHARALLGALGALAIAGGAAPVLATITLGAIVVFGRRFALGDTVDIGGKRGRVRALTLLDFRLEAEDGTEVRVPHLALLLRTATVEKGGAALVLEVPVDPCAPQAHVQEILREVAAAHGSVTALELVSLDASGARHRIEVAAAAPGARNAILCAIAERLAKEGVALAKAPPR